jgi:hypothetical protein
VRIGKKVEEVYSAQDSVPQGVWSYVAGTYDGKSLNLFINGKLAASKKVSGEINTHAQPLRIGGDGIYYKGLIDEVSIYNSALSAAEIVNHYQAVKKVVAEKQKKAPAASWHFNEGTGTKIADSSTNKNNGTIGGAAWVNGKFGKALRFDGCNDYVEIPYNCILNPKKAITLEAWIYPSSTWGDQRIISKSAYPYNDYSMIRATNNRVLVSMKLAGATQSIYSQDNTVPVGTWTYVVGTYDGSKLAIYINGKLSKSSAVTGDIGTHTEPLLGYADFDIIL